MEIAGTSSATEVVSRDSVGIAGLTADDFMQMLITQLQNQDPTEPLGNEELLNQLSTMRNLQSDIELTETLEAITSNQQLATASTFLGKTVTGTTRQNNDVIGVVERAFLRDGVAHVSIGDAEVPLSNVTTVSEE